MYCISTMAAVPHFIISLCEDHWKITFPDAGLAEETYWLAKSPNLIPIDFISGVICQAAYLIIIKAAEQIINIFIIAVVTSGLRKRFFHFLSFLIFIRQLEGCIWYFKYSPRKGYLYFHKVFSNFLQRSWWKLVLSNLIIGK